jgi:hypothetical protein
MEGQSLFSVRNSSTNKAEGEDSSLWWGKISSDSTFCVVLAAHFSSVSVWFKCCNAGLQSLFKVKTLNVLLCGCRNNEHAARVWKELSFCGRFFRLEFCRCFLFHTAKRTSYNMWSSLTEIFSIFQDSIEWPGTCWKDPPPSSVQPASGSRILQHEDAYLDYS